MNPYPVSISEVKAYGIDRWILDGKPNVLSGEYQRIYRAVFNAYQDAFADLINDRSIFYTGIINYKTVPYLSQFIFENLRVIKLNELGLDNGHGKRKDFNVDKIDFNLSTIENLKEHWRIIRTNYGHCNLYSAFFPKITNKSNLLLGDRKQKELSEYIKESGKGQPICIRPLLYEKILKENLASNKHLDLLQDRLNIFFGALISQIPEVEHVLIGNIKSNFSLFFQTILNVLVNTIEELSSWKQKKLLITHVGNIYHRLFSSAWKELGGETIGFSHGNIYPYAYNPGDILNGAIDILNKFVVASKGEKELLNDATKDFGGRFGGKTEFISYSNSIYKPIFETLQNDPPIKKISKVMLIGHPMDYFNSPYLSFMNTMSLFHLELRLMKELKNAGFKVVYKAHPDTISEIDGIYVDYADEVVAGRFENCYKKCDCILFTKPFSTTFGYALMTNMPVVLLNSPQIKWHEKVYPLLGKRCSIVSTDIDSNGYISFDRKSLIDGVKEAMERLNYELIYKYAL